MSGEAPGWYGKLPALGDFARRRLADDFVAAWDDWLQRSMLSSQQSLGPDWLERYLTAHVWRFLLMPGVIGESAHAGVLMSSVDRVGRYFPLTLCSALGAPQSDHASFERIDRWCDMLEVAARASLEPDSQVESFDASVLGLGLPPLAGASANPNLVAALAANASVVSLDFGTDGLATHMEALGAGLLGRTLLGHSLWWCRDHAGQSGGFAHLGLPEARLYATMLSYSPGA
ncbi:type VI secretion system-associated protein TagF [Niveibacterium sp. SC-1]|uniref:type VI secretion system-associated protein TagF n=1 Tax=Niveibacterium sp. SC-1 TaxID=3135646 RepID=UPI00311FAFE0